LNRSFVDRLVAVVGLVVAVACLAASGLLFYAHSYVHGEVSSQLKEQKISFPPAGSEALTSLPAADRKAMEDYAGQEMESGDQAKTFAEHFIKVHLKEIAGGETYSQVSAKAQADPENQQLQGQTQALFRGETLRGLLLNAYAFDKIGALALVAAWVSLAAGLLLLALGALGLLHARRVAPPAE
jgi:hypothetical protein